MNANRKHLKSLFLVLVPRIKALAGPLKAALSGSDTFYRAHSFCAYDSWYFFPSLPVSFILDGWHGCMWEQAETIFVLSFTPIYTSAWLFLMFFGWWWATTKTTRVEMYIILLSLWFIFSLTLGARDLLQQWGWWFSHHPYTSPDKLINGQGDCVAKYNVVAAAIY